MELEEAKSLHQQGRLDEAEQGYLKILSKAPRNDEVFYLLAVLYIQAKRYSQAGSLLIQAIEVFPEIPQFHFLYATVHKAESRLPEAIVEFNRALELNPDYGEALVNLGNTLIETEEFERAFSVLSRAVELSPHDPVAYNSLGLCHKRQGDVANAAYAFEMALILSPGYSAAQINLDEVLVNTADYRKAIALFEKRLQENPKNPNLRLILGRYCSEVGDIDAAVEAFEGILEIEPQHPQALYFLARTGAISGRSRHVESMKRVLGSANIHPNVAVMMNFALARVMEDCGEYGDAYTYTSHANAILAKQEPFDREAFRRQIDATIHYFSTTGIDAVGDGEEVPSPLFIIGMLRSGTTLFEQVLAAHTEIATLGELDYVNWMATTLGQRYRMPDSYPECLNGLGAEQLRREAAQYLQLAGNRIGNSEGVAYFVDKMPGNYLHLGLLAKLFPGARFVQMERSPLDVCLSCYFQWFSGGHAYANSMEDLVFYYQQYRRLMDFWKEIMPDRILSIDYEDLVTQPETTIRRVLDHLGLDWQPGCLSFHEVDRVVKTASIYQVRQKLYQSSVGRAQHYSEQLAPYRHLLESER